jgi:hypothetical protein
MHTLPDHAGEFLELQEMLDRTRVGKQKYTGIGVRKRSSQTPVDQRGHVAAMCCFVLLGLFGVDGTLRGHVAP